MQSTTHMYLTPSARTSPEDLQRLARGFAATYDSESTRRAYLGDLEQMFRWADDHGFDPLDDMGRMHFEMWARHMETVGLAPSTRSRRIGTARLWFDWMLDEQLVAERRNPLAKVKQPTPEVVRERAVLTRREAGVLMQAAREDHPLSWAVVSLMFLNGLRVGTVCRLNVDSVAKVQWHRTLQVVRKGAKRREVKLPEQAYAAVAAAVEASGQGGDDPIVDADGVPLLVTTTTDPARRLNRRHVSTIIERLCRDNGLTRITPHGVRRTAITLLLQDGVAAREVQLFAGHSRLDTTMIYDMRTRQLDEHLSTELLRAVA